jgi:ketosteroid isomerase-like protein
MRSILPVVALAATAAISVGAYHVHSQTTSTPQQAVDELLDADRAFSKASGQTDLIAGLSAMWADDVVMPVPGGTFARGAAAVIAALRANPDNAKARAEWKPVRGGISADGQHGFTFGYMTVRQADRTRVPLKYLAYWVRESAGWKVAAYKRARANEAPESVEMMAPALPSRIVPVSTDAAAVERHRRSLDEAERAFSDEAQKIGIGPAFAKYGSADAINLGPPTASRVLVGAEAIGRFVGSAYPAGHPGVSWAPDSVLVASSGDLGITFGMIRANGPLPDGPSRPPVPFFTIWRRADSAKPWRYVAE